MRLIGLTATGTARLLELEREETAEAERTESDPDAKVIMTGNMAVGSRRKLLRCIKAMIAISMLGTVFVFFRLHYFREDNVFSFSFASTTFKIGDVVKLKLADRTLSFMDPVTGKHLLVKFVSDALNAAPSENSCATIFADSGKDNNLRVRPANFENCICLKWKNAILVINDTQSRGSQCYSVEWFMNKEVSSPKNCFTLSGAHWYGGSLLSNQQWPLEDNSVKMQPFVSAPINVFETASFRQFGPVLERMWINSAGFGVVADREIPLHVSVNAMDNSQLCLKSQFKGSRYLTGATVTKLRLNYTVCMDRTTRQVHGHLMKNFVTLPSSGPSERLMQDPVWSTRGINMRSLKQAQVLDLDSNITRHNFQHSQLHIAGNFTRTIGGVFFDHERFSHAHQMISELKGRGYIVSTSVLPVLEKDVFPYSDGLKHGAFVNISQKQVQGLEWMNKSVALVDFTNPEACEWMSQRLKDFKLEASVGAFHFDSGEAILLSGGRQTAVPLPNHCDYSKYYVKFAHSQGNSSVVSVGYGSQQYGLMVDIGARSSTWGYELGLKSLIPSVLTLGLLGYPFTMVGPVGGVPAHKFELSHNRYPLPEEELYIRWLQLSVFLPGLEISVGPWQYNKEVVDMAQALFKRRADHVFPLLQTAAKEFLHTGAPIIRPLWWMATDDETAQRIDCEFLVSNKLLVAPVLEAGARHRSVYLPKVKDLKWQDDLRGGVYKGGQWIHGYKVGLHEVATFRPVFRSQTG